MRGILKISCNPNLLECLFNLSKFAKVILYLGMEGVIFDGISCFVVKYVKQIHNSKILTIMVALIISSDKGWSRLFCF